MLPKILDTILNNGGTFRIPGSTSARPATTRAMPGGSPGDSRAGLERILAQSTALSLPKIADLTPADIEGAFPEGFYSTTNQRTEVRLAGEWVPVLDQEMDCGIVVERRVARGVPMNEIRRGDAVVVGHAGVRVFPEERLRGPQTFAFMDSNVSTEKPKGIATREIARELVHQRSAGGSANALPCGWMVRTRRPGSCLSPPLLLGV